MFDDVTLKRFWGKVDRSPGHGPQGECWVWIPAVKRGKYGKLRISGKQIVAHRISLALKLERPIQDGLLSLHSCDYPPCVNPSHLREGTAQDNTDDMRSRNRQLWSHEKRKGEDNPKAKLTADDVRQIRSMDLPRRTVAGMFGVSREAICDIMNNRTWKEIS